MMFILETANPIAVLSLDHIDPLGTAKDNSINLKFNKKLYELYSGQDLTVLDLGCAGGGFVRTVIDDGYTAVGLEGSDYSLVNKRAEWAVIPDNLFTCDITHPFTLHTGDGKPFEFDCVTAWEVMEHINEEDLPMLLDNIRRHIRKGGLFIGSITVKWYPHHVTCKPDDWWQKLIEDSGFIRNKGAQAFIAPDWLRESVINFVYRRL